jgi:hypothetical protein
VELFELVEGGGLESPLPSPLGFSSLLLSMFFPCRMLHPTFLILSATRKYSFSFEICSIPKSDPNFIFTTKKIKEGVKKIDISLKELGGPLIRLQGAENPLRVESHKEYYKGEWLHESCLWAYCGELQRIL